MQTQVTIIGAGIVGICCALSLRDRGHPVRLLDRGEPGQETSYGNAGVISPWSIIPQPVPGIWKKIPGMMFGDQRPLAVRAAFWPRMIPWGMRFLRHANEESLRSAADAMEYLCAPSVELYRRHLAGTGHEDLVVDSSYLHAFRQADRADLKALDYRIRIEKGGDLELMGSDTLRRLEPGLSREFKAAVAIKGQARARAPGRIAQVLADKARGLGVEIIRTEVKGLARSGEGWEISTDQGPLHAERVVLAAGVWSEPLLRGLGFRLPLVAERGYHVEFAAPQAELNNSVMDVDAKIVASSMLGGLRVAGSAEFASPDAPPDPRRQALLTRQARAICPDLDTTSPSFWMGRRPSLPDSLPVLGQIDGQPGLFGAFGHSHHGLMMAPKTGEVLADILSGKRLNHDISAFSAQRFA